MLSLVLLVMAFYIAVGAFSYSLSLSPKGSAKKKSLKNMQRNADKYQIDFDWWDKQPFETMTITSHDNYQLVGHLLEAKSNKVVILIHGYGGNFKEMYNYARFFQKRNYTILSMECRAHGASEGDMIGMGWLDRLDVLQWLDLLLQKKPNCQIVLFGLSMGGATVCMTLGEKLPNNVICAVSDCSFDNVYRQFSYVFTHHTHFPSRFIMSIFSSYMKRTKHFDLKKADAVKQLKKSTLPIMFIHGDSDTFVPTEMVHLLADAVPESRREVYIAKDAEHAMSYVSDPKLYELRLDKFLSKYHM